MGRLLSWISWAIKIGSLSMKLPALVASAIVLAWGAWLYLQSAPLWNILLTGLGLFTLVFAIGFGLITYLCLPAAGMLTPRYLRWYLLPLGRLSWRFDNFLGGRAPPVRITSFQPAFRINRTIGIEPRKAYIWSPRTGQRADVLVECGNPYVRADAIEFMPRGKWYQCQVFFGDAGLSKEEFLDRFDGFEFVFEYDETQFKRVFDRSEIEFLFDTFASMSTPRPEVRPTLRSDRP